MTDDEYDIALARISALMDVAEIGTPESDELIVLVQQVVEYEKRFGFDVDETEP